MMPNDQKPIAGLPDDAPVDTRPRRGGVAPVSGRDAFRTAGGSMTMTVWTLSSVVLASCGGGGGGGTAGEHTPQITLTFTSSTDGEPNLAENDASLTSNPVYTARAISVTEGATIRYSLAPRVEDNDFFSINPTSGAVTFQNIGYVNADMENADNGVFDIRITAMAIYASHSPQTTFRDVRIRIADINDEAPIFTSGKTETARLVENRVTMGEVVYTARANPDISSAQMIYELPNNAPADFDNNLFSINSGTGEITFKDAGDADYEHNQATDGAFSIRISAHSTHSTGTSRIAEYDVTIRLENMGDVDPVLTYTAGNNNELSPGSTIWETIGSFAVIDPDNIQDFSDFNVGDFRFDGVAPNSTTGEFAIQNAGAFRVRKSTASNNERFFLEAREIDFDATGLSDVAGGKGYAFAAITVLDPAGISSNVADNVNFTVMPPPMPITLPSETNYENHPVHKDAYTFTAPNGKTGTWSLPDVPDGGTTDNTLFSIDNDGRLWWRASPDYESSADDGGDNTYDIKAIFTTDAGVEHEYNLPITVGNIARELLWSLGDTPEKLQALSDELTLDFSRENLREEDLPENELVEYLFGFLGAWKVPQTGPLILTWSLSGRGVSFPLNTQERIDAGRMLLNQAFAQFEKAANLKFIEVLEDNEMRGDISITIVAGLTGGEAHGPGLWGYLSTVISLKSAVHEIGHVLGLKHPFEGTSDWPGDNVRYRYSPDTVMSYYDDRDSGLKEADKLALQFLYGAPNTDYQGIESKLALGPPPAPLPINADGLIPRITEDDPTGIFQGSTASGGLRVDWPGEAINYEARGKNSAGQQFVLGNDSANSGKGAAIEGKYGTLYLKTDGSWIYEIDNSRPETDSLQNTETFIDEIFEARARSASNTGHIGESIGILVDGRTDTDVFASGSEGVADLSEGSITTGTILYSAEAPATFTGSDITFTLPENLLDNRFFNIVSSGTNAGVVRFNDAADADADRGDVLYDGGEAVFKIGVKATSSAGEEATQYVSIRLGDINDESPVFASLTRGNLNLFEFKNFATTVLYSPGARGDISSAVITYQLEEGVLDNDLFRIDHLNHILFRNPDDAKYNHPEATNGVFDIQVSAIATHETGVQTAKHNVAIQIVESAIPPDSGEESISNADFGVDPHDHAGYYPHDDEPSPPAQDFG